MMSDNEELKGIMSNIDRSLLSFKSVDSFMNWQYNMVNLLVIADFRITE